MADQPSLQIDTDWKKQAQEEKRRLAEQQTKAAPAAPAESIAPPASTAAAARSREIPAASFASLVQSIVTQALYHLGDLAVRGGESSVNLDLAKHHIDSMAILEAKTKGNLSADEQRLLDSALYEARMRYVNVASQYIT